MNNYDCGCTHGTGVIPGPCVPKKDAKPSLDLRIKTEVIPASAGTDAKGQPFAPELGAYYNAVVRYEANGAIYFYDTRGIWTKMSSEEELAEKIAAETAARVQADTWLQQNINAEVNARESDRDNLQTNINQEVENRTAADAEINSKLEGMNHDIDNLLELTEAIPNTIVSDITGETTVAGTTLTISKSTLNSSETSTSEIVIPAGGSGGNDPRLTDDGASKANNLPNTVVTSGLGIKTNTEGRFIVSTPVQSLADGTTSDDELSFPMASGVASGMMTASDKTKLNRVPQTVVSATGLRQTSDDQKTSILVKYKNVLTGDAYDDVVEIPIVSTQYNGLMTPAQKAKLDGLSEGGGSIGAPTYTADTVNLGSTQLTAAKGTQEGMVGQAGIMSSFQATQLAALASAYEAEEKGTTLYSGTASVNNITLSESGLSYDHLIIVAEYMGMGSSALKQQVSAVFYPTNEVKAFQMTATDITVGDAPAQSTVQDIWMISEDGLELDLASSTKTQITKNGTLDFEVTPETTSMFTITKVVGFGKTV